MQILRIAWYEKRLRFFKYTLKNNSNQCYKNIGKIRFTRKPVPSKGENVEIFEYNLAKRKMHKTNSRWIDSICTDIYSLEKQNGEGIKVEDVRPALRISKIEFYWSSGKYKIANFWLNAILQDYEFLRMFCNELVWFPLA